MGESATLATVKTRTGMLLPSELVNSCDRRLIEVRSAQHRRVSRTRLAVIALERMLQLNDVDFAEAVYGVKTSGRN